ncbi:hypothetical protein C2857_007418 [Epichloe festucae Fl1]|uniref:Uncharacterized protein n=1 Tax=Epichloe festucae (strain Fl1) TaxID=877507 RepID=A0A7S9KQT0_EPIFF|nr:hypothetical protein C2857_007418 [Epichloe festucae Fl1]
MPPFKYSKGPLLRAEQALTETAGDIVSNSVATGKGSQVTQRKNQPIDGDDSEAIERIAPTSPAYDTWTRERWLQRLWESSKMKADTSREGHAASVLQIKLWKTCCTFMGCSPCSVISPRYGLHYMPNRIDEDDVDVNDDDDDISRFKKLGMWPSAFCGKLSTLICQPLWNDDPTMLATAVQFAVICRTASVEPWKMALAARNIPEMEVLRRQAESGFPQQSAYSFIEQQCRDGIARNDRLPVELNFLHHLGAFIEKKARRRLAESDLTKRLSQGVYRVKVIDLEAILGALDTFNPDNGLLVSTETIEHIRRCRASDKSFPAGEVVFDLHRRAFLNEWRLFFLEKQAETDTGPSSDLVVQLRTAASTRGEQRKRAKPSTPASGGSDEDLESPPARRPQKRPRHTTTVIPSDSEGDIDEEEDDGFAPPSGGEYNDDERAQDKPGQRAEKSKTKDVIEDSADELEVPNVADAAATEAGSEVASTDADAGAAVDVSGMDVGLGTDQADLGTANAEREAEISNTEILRLTSPLAPPAATQTSSVQAPQTTQEPTDTQASSEPPVSAGPQKRKLSADDEYKAIRDEMQAELIADVRAIENRRYYSQCNSELWE